LAELQAKSGWSVHIADLLFRIFLCWI